MISKKSAKTYCQYCKKVLSDTKEIKLQYHKSCNKKFLEFENIHKKIAEQLTPALGLPENQIVEFINNEKLQYSLSNKGNFIELRISDAKLDAIQLSSSELENLEILCINNDTQIDRDGSFDPPFDNEGLINLPENIGELENLKVLDLSGNRLTMLPDSIGNLINLKELTLDINWIKNLPESFGNLKNLETLNLKHNPIETLPDSFENLINLKKLFLDFGNINTYNEEHRFHKLTLPENFGNLPALEEFRIYGAYGYGWVWIDNSILTLPKSFSNLKKLHTLVINAKFRYETYNISNPPAFTDFNLLPENLMELDLGTNNLKEVPAEIGNLSNLEKLSLSENYLETIPSDVGNLTNIKELDLSFNQLKELPIEIGDLTNLEWACFNKNEIDSIPESFTNLKNLKFLSFKSYSKKQIQKIDPIIKEFFKEMKRKSGLKLSTAKSTSIPLYRII